MNEGERMNPILVGDTIRFTVICPELVRIEYSRIGRFVDEPTLFAALRSSDESRFTTVHESGVLRIATDRFELEYPGEGAKPDNENLVIRLGRQPSSWPRGASSEGNATGEPQGEWRPGMQNTENLGGPLQTLDNCTGALPLGDGLLSRNGWYLLDDSRAHVFEDGWIAERPHLHSEIDWYFFGYGSDYRAALHALALVGGKVPLPRKHVLGSWYCRWWPYTSDDYRQIVSEYEEHDFPIDVLVMDMDWHRRDGTTGFGWCNRGAMGWTGWSWNRDLLPDVEDLIAELRADDVYVTLNAHPHDGVRTNEDMYDDFMRELGHDPSEKRDLPFLSGDRRYVEAYFRHAHEPHERMGVDFWWVDWQQDSIMPFVYHIPYLKHLPWLNYLYFKNSEKLGRRGLGFSRWAGWGDHRHPIHFSGDTAANWEVLEFEIPFTVASGNAGCFFWSHDTGGFSSKERDPELYTRWVQFCALSAALRLHSAGAHLDRRPWLWGEPYTSAMREAFHLRAQLMPYIYTAARQSHDQTVPLLRAMYLDHPHEQEAYEHPNQYFLGDDLLLAPVVKPGSGANHCVSQQVWIPGGTWYHWYSGESTHGPAIVEVATPLDEIPLWVRAGAIIPMQQYSPRMSSARSDVLVLRCTPCVDSSEPVRSLLYEDDGQSEDYRDGSYRTTRLGHSREHGTHTIMIAPSEGSFEAQTEERSVELHLRGFPRIRVAMGSDTRLEISGTAGDQIVLLPRANVRTGVTVTLG